MGHFHLQQQKALRMNYSKTTRLWIKYRCGKCCTLQFLWIIYRDWVRRTGNKQVGDISLVLFAVATVSAHQSVSVGFSFSVINILIANFRYKFCACIPLLLAYSIPIFGIKYWNEVICKAFQLRQHMHPLYSIQWWLLFWFFFYFDGESIIEQSKRTTSTNTSIYIVPVVCSSFIPLCGALIAFTINPSCIVCTANTIETNRKKQFFFILLGKIVATPRNQNGLFSHINTM